MDPYSIGTYLAFGILGNKKIPGRYKIDSFGINQIHQLFENNLAVVIENKLFKTSGWEKKKAGSVQNDADPKHR